MDEIKRKRLKNQVIAQLRQQEISTDPFHSIIKIYVDMLMQKEVLEQRLNQYKGDPESENILAEALRSLNEDIQAYLTKLTL